MDEFKVVSISSNTNSFGLRGVVFISRSGKAWQVGASALHVPKRGQVFSFPEGKEPPFAKWGFEIPERLSPDPPKEVMQDIWG